MQVDDYLSSDKCLFRFFLLNSQLQISPRRKRSWHLDFTRNKTISKWPSIRNEHRLFHVRKKHIHLSSLVHFSMDFISRRFDHLLFVFSHSMNKFSNVTEEEIPIQNLHHDHCPFYIVFIIVIVVVIVVVISVIDYEWKCHFNKFSRKDFAWKNSHWMMVIMIFPLLSSECSGSVKFESEKFVVLFSG